MRLVTPQAAIDNVAAAVRQAVAQPELQKRMVGLGLSGKTDGRDARLRLIEGLS